MSTVIIDTPNRLLPAGPGAGHDLAAHHALHGTLVVPSDDDGVWRASMREAVSRSGVSGRGGGGFPSATKWDPVRAGSRSAVLVVNAMEGEPASAKDRHLLIHAPHLVLDGAEVVAEVIGASEVVVCVPDHWPSLAASIERAIAERRSAGLSHRLTSVRQPPGRYVSGEESALVNWLDRRRALPVYRTDKSRPLQLGRRPALVHNAETLAQVALVARHGPEWFRRLGPPDAPGTTLVTVSGAVRRPGVVEVEMGTPVADILDRAGVDTPLSAVLVGGYGGAWLDGSQLSTAYAPRPLAAVGATLGVGILIALPAWSCGIAETARMTRYLAGESAGQCGPCVFGLPAMAHDLEQLWSGRVDQQVLERLGGRAGQITGRGACGHPDGAARLVQSALRVFAADAREHRAGRPCPGHTAATVLTLPAEPTQKEVR
jgi:NADH:ubiquinone oxidoreductase subunit F (NADH-binding)